MQQSHFGATAFLLGGLIGCGNFAQTLLGSEPQISDISRIRERQERGARVYLRGTVGDQAPFLNSRAYELQDETGAIWVVTAAAAPNAGDEVLIQGIVRYKSIPLAGQEQGETFVEAQTLLEQSPTSTTPDRATESSESQGNPAIAPSEP